MLPFSCSVLRQCKRFARYTKRRDQAHFYLSRRNQKFKSRHKNAFNWGICLEKTHSLCVNEQTSLSIRKEILTILIGLIMTVPHTNIVLVEWIFSICFLLSFLETIPLVWISRIFSCNSDNEVLIVSGRGSNAGVNSLAVLHTDVNTQQRILIRAKLFQIFTVTVFTCGPCL
jgi:hypothetical protein